MATPDALVSPPAVQRKTLKRDDAATADGTFQAGGSDQFGSQVMNFGNYDSYQPAPGAAVSAAVAPSPFMPANQAHPRVPAAALASSFTDDKLASKRQGAVGAGMNRLDEVTYDLDDASGGTARQMTGYFKAEKRSEDLISQTRGHDVGMTSDDPNIVGRNLATYAVAKLLGADVIAPTWAARHEHEGAEVWGIVMEKIKGKSGKEEAAEAANDPKVKQGLSNLYLLDQICGQVDRHKGNYIIQRDSEGVITGVKGIDNDLAFGKEYRDYKVVGRGGDLSAMDARVCRDYVAGLSAGELEGIDREMAEKIVRLAGEPTPLAAAIAIFLTQEEVDATLDRLKSLGEFLRPLLASNDARIKSSWS